MSALIHHWHLFWQFTRRSVHARYRGSVFGMAWSFIAPLLLLAVYSFVFIFVFKARWPMAGGGNGSFALALFSGLILHGFLMECLNQATGSITGNVNLVKKVIFPLEILPLSAVAAACFHLLLALLILLGGMLLFGQAIPLAVVFSPVVLLPFLLFTAGLTYGMAALSVYLRDLAQVMGITGTVLLFTSTVFFPVEALPELLRPYVFLNPLTWPVEALRGLLFNGVLPDWHGSLYYSAAAIGVFLLGQILFFKLRRGFADVL